MEKIGSAWRGSWEHVPENSASTAGKMGLTHRSTALSGALTKTKRFCRCVASRCVSSWWGGVSAGSSSCGAILSAATSFVSSLRRQRLLRYCVCRALTSCRHFLLKWHCCSSSWPAWAATGRKLQNLSTDELTIRCDGAISNFRTGWRRQASFSLWDGAATQCSPAGSREGPRCCQGDQ